MDNQGNFNLLSFKSLKINIFVWKFSILKIKMIFKFEKIVFFKKFQNYYISFNSIKKTFYIDNNQYSVKVKKSEPLLKNSKSELSDIIEMIVKMAYETEEKKLNKELVEKAIEKLLKYPIYGQYFFIIDSLLDKFCGMNLVTFEHNINLDTTILWIQSVFVHEDYRMKGLFRRLLYKNEDYVLENKGFKKTVKLYMDKDNEKAEKVYFKVGFKVCKEILYELDFHFDDISELKNSNKENSENETNKSFVKINILGVKHTDDKNDLNLHGGIFTDEFYKYVLNVNEINNPEINEIFGNGNNNKNRAIHFESLINGNKIDIQEEKEKLMKVISNRNLGMILVISNVSWKDFKK